MNKILLNVKMKKVLSFSVTIFGTFFCQAQTQLPNFFSDSMVLQQQTEVAIWGKDKPNKKINITASWGEKSQTVTNESGFWKLKIKTHRAGGPFKIEIKGSDKITYNNVLVGEVWLCSGQSNMEMPMKGYNNQAILGSNEAILNSYNPLIRCFNAPKKISQVNAYDVSAFWKNASPANTGSFSATAYFFAKKMHAILNVPIGIIHTSWGGSVIECWMDSSTLSNFMRVKIPDTIIHKNAHNTHTALYKAMLHPFVGYTIKGMLWYQGESNRERAAAYHKLFPAFINMVRKQWQNDSLPFYFAQTAPHGASGNTKFNNGHLREAQLKTMLEVANTGMAVTMDIGEEFSIHPSQKEMVGNRLAYWALAKNYGVEGVAYAGPVFNKIEENKNDTITISFKYAPLGLTSFGKPLTDFEIAGEDKVFYNANAALVKGKADQISISSPQVKNPVHVRYAFKNFVQGCLYNTQGLPASSFRTDDW